MARANGWKSVLSERGPEADISLQDVLADPGAFVVIFGILALALLL